MSPQRLEENMIQSSLIGHHYRLFVSGEIKRQTKQGAMDFQTSPVCVLDSIGLD